MLEVLLLEQHPVLVDWLEAPLRSLEVRWIHIEVTVLVEEAKQVFFFLSLRFQIIREARYLQMLSLLCVLVARENVLHPDDGLVDSHILVRSDMQALDSQK